MKYRPGLRMRAKETYGLGPYIPPPIEDWVRQYNALEQRIVARYEHDEDASDLEARAAVILERIDTAWDELYSEEKDDDVEPPVQIILIQFADAWDNAMRTDYGRDALADFFARGAKPVYQPPSIGVTTRGERVPIEGWWEWPAPVGYLRELVEDANADAVALLEAAKDASEWRKRIINRLRLGRGATDPVADARSWLVKHAKPNGWFGYGRRRRRRSHVHS